ncbi:MAG: right-handed parallel beta-helix repeat-containing protein [Thermoplasmata archaeon]|nr:right-handed parallel beta-helix repeat-containing protein [Thermoplasmata archaeon]
MPLVLALTIYASLASVLFTVNVVQAQTGLDYIIITDSPNGTAIDNMTYDVGENDTYYCSGYNYTTGYLGLELCDWYSENWAVGTVTPVRNSTTTTFTAVSGGTTRVRAIADNGNLTVGAVDWTGTLTVTPEGLDYIIIMRSPDGGSGQLGWVGDTTYHLGEMDWFFAVAFNNSQGQIGMVIANWTTTNSTVCNITAKGDSTTFHATAEGTCKITAEFLGKYTNTTGTLTVNGKLDYIEITDAPDGNPIGDMNYTLGETDEYYCSGYNYTQGYLGLEDCWWDSQNWTVGDVQPRYGENVTFITKSLGTTYVTANDYDPGQNISWDTTGRLDVLAENVDYIVIVDSPTSGKWVGNRTYNLADTDTFYALAYNNSLGPLGLIPVDWTTTNSTVCSITTHGESTSFKALKEGTCKVIGDYQGIYSNSTGTLTVTKGGMITVDDDGSADYKTIQEAIDAATPGDTIFVYAGTYPENVIVNKTVTLKGEDETKVIVTGGGSGTVFYVTADSVSIFHFTIRDGRYGIYSDHTDGLVLDHNIITNYTYGLYQDHTTDSWVTYNDISVGKYGIVTNYAHNDAIRYNFISYNTVYGAKDFNSQLKNCFNWNKFYKNKIAYWYDPDQPLDTLEFDGNILEENEIGIKVNGSSTVKLTNNTLLNNGIGIYILDASPLVMSNTLTGNSIGIYCEDSSSLFYQNTITGSDFGIYCENASPRIEENVIDGSDEDAIRLVGSAAGTIIDNDVGRDPVYVEDSQVDEVSLLDTDLESVSSTFGNVELDTRSSMTMKWRLKVHVLDEDGQPVQQAKVSVFDFFGDEVKSLFTRGDGWTDEFVLIQKVDTSDGSEPHTPHVISAVKDDLTGSVEDAIELDKQLSIIIAPPPADAGLWLPLELLVVLGSSIILGAGVAVFLASEGFKIALISLFLPLYMKLKKGKLLDNYDRGRVYQYIVINPGEHYNQIRRDLSLPNGSLVHHLRVLEQGEKIKSRRDGRFRRFYTRSTQIPVTNGGELTEVQKRITDSAKDLPGITQKEMASLLGIHQSSVSYQMSKLEERGLIRTEKKGRKVHYYYVGK